MSGGGTVQSIANLSKGQDRGNAVTIQVSYSIFKTEHIEQNASYITFKTFSNF